jgi:nucleotide-binding universal stress UspA family protein
MTEAAMFARILVPTDFSEPSDAALECARAIAARLGASLHLLHVFEPPAYLAGASPEVYVADAAAVQAALIEEAQNRLAQRVTANDRECYRATTEIVLGKSSTSIVEYATDRSMDLIVMGTHGRSGMSHLLMGSVAEQIVRTAPCPVMTVRRMPTAAVDVANDLVQESAQAGG